MSHADARWPRPARIEDSRASSGRSLGPRRTRAMSEPWRPELATPLRERAERALGDPFLKQALDIATTKFIGLRREAFDEFPEGEALRDRARAIKEATLQSLDRYVDQLVENIERRGGHVHYAATA